MFFDWNKWCGIVTKSNCARGKARIQSSGMQCLTIVNLGHWLLSSVLISKSWIINKMSMQAQYGCFSHQNNKKWANKIFIIHGIHVEALYSQQYHQNFNLDKPSWAPPPPHPICQILPMHTPWVVLLTVGVPSSYTTATMMKLKLGYILNILSWCL